MKSFKYIKTHFASPFQKHSLVANVTVVQCLDDVRGLGQQYLLVLAHQLFNSAQKMTLGLNKKENDWTNWFEG